MKKHALSFLLLALTLGIQGMEEDNSQGDPSFPPIKYPISPAVMPKSDNDVVDFILPQRLTVNENKEEGDENDQAITFPQAHFSPNIVNVIQKLINDEKEEIKGAMYQFTYYPIAQAMADRLNQNVQISLVINRGCVENKKKEEIPLCVPLNMIIKAGGKIHKKNKGKEKGSKEKYENMHHKFLILKKNITDKPLVMTGSFNFTGAGHQSWENIVILDDSEAIEKFEEEFNKLLQYSSNPLKEEECVSPKDTEANTYSRTTNAFPEKLIESAQPRFLPPNTAADYEIPQECLIVVTPPEERKKPSTHKRKPPSKGKQKLNTTV